MLISLHPISVHFQPLRLNTYHQSHVHGVVATEIKDAQVVAEITDVVMVAVETVVEITAAEMEAAEMEAVVMEAAEMAVVKMVAGTTVAETVAETEAVQITIAMRAINEMADIVEAMTARTGESQEIMIVEVIEETISAVANNATMTAEKIAEITVEVNVAETGIMIAETTVEAAKVVVIAGVVMNHVKTVDITAVRLLRERTALVEKVRVKIINPRVSEPLLLSPGQDLAHQGLTLRDAVVHPLVRSKERSDDGIVTKF